MTETIAPPETATEPPHILQRPATDEAALRAIEDTADHLKERALAIRANPEAHKPRLVLSKHVRGMAKQQLDG